MKYTEIGKSDIYLDFQDKIQEVANIDRTVLLIGERGSGKELAARRIHYLSKRWNEKIVTVNCAAIPSALIESELFGSVKGAFTGATNSRSGKFEEAEGGTLFLDEIGLLNLEVQEKLLRVVEYGTYERLGSNTSYEANVRIIGATNADLKQLCKEGKFKEDLLDRLSFEVIFIPPLRMRGDDIILLTNYYAAKMANECGKATPTLSDTVINKIKEYSWPGNVRELKNTIERAVYKTEGNIIHDIQLDPFQNPYKEKTISEDINLGEYKEYLRNVDIRFVKDALAKANSNQRTAAELLNITYDQFRGLYKKYKDYLWLTILNLEITKLKTL